MSNVDVVRQMIEGYRSQDRATAETLLADDLVFTSPQDDHLDRTTYLSTCFPTADHFISQVTLSVADAGLDGVFWLYEYQLTNHEVYRNAEHLTVRDGQIHEIQVFFGGRVR